MTCREFADVVMSYLDGELDATQRRPFEDHLADCAHCVRFLREYRATFRAGQFACADEPPVDVPDDLVKAILDARPRAWLLLTAHLRPSSAKPLEQSTFTSSTLRTRETPWCARARTP